MSKYFRVILKILAGVLLCMLLLFGICWGLLQLPSIQLSATQQVSSWIANKTHTRVDVGAVNIDFFQNLILEDVYLEDNQQDTLLYGGRLDVNIALFSLLRKEFFIDKISLKKTKVFLHRADSIFNFQFFADTFADSVEVSQSEDTTSPSTPWKYGLGQISLSHIDFRLKDSTDGYAVSCNLPKGHICIQETNFAKGNLLLYDITLSSPSIAYHNYSPESDTTPTNFPESGWTINSKNTEIDNITFLYKDHTYPELEEGVDFNHLYITDGNIWVNDLQVSDSLISGEVKDLSLAEKSGFNIKSLMGSIRLTPEAISALDLNLKTSNSDASIMATLAYDEFNQLADFSPDLQLFGQVDHSTLSFRDIFLFAPDLKSTLSREMANENITFKGKVTGTPAKMSGVDWKASLGSTAQVHANIAVSNMLNPGKMGFFLDLKQFSTKYEKVQRMLQDTIPAALAPLGDIAYSGVYNGGLSGGRLEGILKTGAGAISADLTTIFDEGYGNANYKGEISLFDFDIGKFVENDSIGRLTLFAKVDGSGLSADSLFTKIDVEALEINFNDYPYHDVEVHGEINQQQFVGQIGVSDKNLQLDFDGEINFNDSIPTYQFTALVDTINPRNLHLSEDSIGFHGEFAINMWGENLENLDGLFEVRDLRLNRGGHSYNEDTLRLNANSLGKFRKITFDSDFANVKLVGDYQVDILPGLLIDFVNQHFPVYQYFSGYEPIDSLGAHVEERKKLTDQDFTIKMEMVNPMGLLKLFVPEVTKLDTMMISATMDSKNRKMNGSLKIPTIQYGDFFADSLNIALSASQKKIKLDIHTDNFRTPNAPDPINIYTDVELQNEKMQIDLRVAKDSVEKLFKMGAVAVFKNGSYLMNLKKKFFINDLKWKIDPTHSVQYTSPTLSISHLTLNRGKQSININGNSNDTLNFVMDKFKVSEIAELFGYEDYELKGKIHGELHVMDVIGDPYFTADLDVKEISAYDELIGDWDVHATLPSHGKHVSIDSKMRGKSDFDFVGDYDLTTSAIDLKTNIRKFQMDIFDPFIGEYISKTSGYLAGNLDISGTTDNPKPNGEFIFHDAGGRIKQLKTYYRLDEDTISISPTKISFVHFDLEDTLGRSGRLGGNIYHNFFSDIEFDLDFSSKKFPFLNTKKKDNDLYYGKVLLDLDAYISGDIDNTDLVINAKTLPGTDLKVFTPDDELEIVQEDYIRFVSPGHLLDETIKSDTILSDEQYHSDITGFNVDLLLEITPEAKLTYVLDKGSGDNIEIHGNSNLNVTMNPSGDVSMLGSYEVTSGEYRFSFENLVKREFEVDPGSRITFLGDPYKSVVDITAVYKTRTPVNELIDNQVADPTGSIAREASRRTEVEVILFIQEKALKPELSFDVLIPAAEEGGVVGSSLARKMAQIRENEAELNKQVFGLLLFNSFVGEMESGIETLGEVKDIDFAIVAISSVSNFVNGQLNNLADKYVKGMEININLDSYNSRNTGGTINSVSELEVGVSKELFNRLTVSVGTGIGMESNTLQAAAQAQQNSGTKFTQLNGNFALSYKVHKDGRYIVRIFRKSDNDDTLSNGGGNTRIKTGLGASFKKTF